MTFPDQTPSSVRKLAAVLARMQEQIADRRSNGLRIPILNDDPPAGDYTNLWMLEDGRLRGRNAAGTIFEYQKVVTPGSSTSGIAKPVPIRWYSHQRTYEIDESKDICPVHGVESSLYYGRYSGTHGERRILFGFDDALIRSQMTTAARMIKVELSITNLHSYANSGVEIYWGAHNSAALPNSWVQVYRNLWHGHWPKTGGSNWRTVPNWFGDAFRDNKIKGLTIDQPSTSVAYYGLVRGDLRVRFTYSNNTP